MKLDTASFRDPSGFVLLHDSKIYRCINICYKDEWEYLAQSNLLHQLQNEGLLIPYQEIDPVATLTAHAPWKLLDVERIPYISYPHEWCFSQLRDAALLMLRLQRMALKSGCSLKDASAYNIQFQGARPVFIDILSFERLRVQQPWQGYRQFCSHFLTSLALQQYVDLRCGGLSSQWIDGIPLDIACSFLPLQSFFSPGIFLHIYLHSREC